jgi:hypothetical protein
MNIKGVRKKVIRSEKRTDRIKFLHSLRGKPKRKTLKALVRK